MSPIWKQQTQGIPDIQHLNTPISLSVSVPSLETLNASTVSNLKWLQLQMCDCWQISHFIPKSISLGQKKISRLCLDITYKGKVLHYSSNYCWDHLTRLISTRLNQSRPDTSCLISTRLYLSRREQTHLVSTRADVHLDSTRLIQSQLSKTNLIQSRPDQSCFVSSTLVLFRLVLVN